MNSVELYQFPLDEPDLRAIIALLRGQQVFVPSFAASVEDVYDPLTYRRQILHYDTATHLLVDRNVVTRWLSILAGISPTPEHRMAAAIMVFAQCANIMVEPNISFYEVASTAGSSAANEELRKFRIADNVQTIHWADIALGRSDRIEISKRPGLDNPTGEEVNFEIPLRRWRRHYITVLKIAELELRGGSSEARMNELLQWMYDDFLISGPAVMLAAHYLAPNNN